MTGFLATTHPVSAARLRRAVSCLSYLGGDTSDAWSAENVSIALTRKQWELGDEFSGDVGLLRRDHLVVAADASLYDRRALVAALATAGVRPGGFSPAHLVAAAYRAWDVRLATHLNGDFAFVIWDAARRRLVAARNINGTRPLFFGEVGESVVVGSSARAVAEAIGRGTSFNATTLGALVAGLPWSAGGETSYEGVETVPPAHVLIAGDGRVRLERYWRPSAAPDRTPMKSEDARVVLRDLLTAAVSDRIGSARATVWMSGGWDSTAVFAAGQQSLPALDRSRLRPVSISYPPNDPGCEDELIEAAAQYWGARIQWLQSADIPLLDALEQRAREADEPPAHLYELWNRALARATRSTGSRIALEGSGGDHLFQVSDIVVADMIRRGAWLDAARHVRARRLPWKMAARVGLLPLLPAALLDGAAAITGGRVLRHYLERPVAPWMRADFMAQHELRERALSILRSERGETHAHTESMLFLMLPVFGLGAAYMHGAFLEEGIEARSPLMDRRIVDFALSRPVVERASAWETKTLLRGAMEGLLPARLLERRRHRTGSTIGFSRLRMREAYPALTQRLLGEPLRLADLGMIDPDALRTSANRACAGQAGDYERVSLFDTMKVEFWLRGLSSRSAGSNLRQRVANCAGQSPANPDRSLYVPET